MRTYRAFIGLLFAGTCFGCDESFTPNAPFKEELVIYSILTNVSDVQYVRLYRTYDAPSYDPFDHLTDNGISGATVIATVDQSQIPFRDTLVARKDSSRYNSPIVAYVANPFAVQRGKAYTLDVLTPDGKSSSTSATVPGLASISIANPASVQQPSPLSEKFIIVRAHVPSTAEGFLIRFFVNYDVFLNGSWTSRRSEIPYLVMLRGEKQIEVFIFPTLNRAPDPIGGVSTISFLFSTYAYQTMVGRLRSRAVQFRNLSPHIGGAESLPILQCCPWLSGPQHHSTRCTGLFQYIECGRRLWSLCARFGRNNIATRILMYLNPHALRPLTGR